MPLSTDEALLALSRDIIDGFDKVEWRAFTRGSGPPMPRASC